MNEAMLQACQTPGFPPDAATAIQTYVSGGGGGGGGGYSAPPPPAHGPAPVEHVVQQLQYVNYVTHEGDTTIQQTIIDQSTSVNVGDNFTGNIDFEVDNAAATGDGSVAGGEGDVNAATGEGSQVIDDSTVGQNQNNSDGSVQVGGDNEAPVVLGPNSGVITDGDIDAPVLVGSTNTGTINDGTIDGPVLSNSTNTGVVADGNVQDTVVGNENQTANVDGNSRRHRLRLGAVTTVNDSIVDDSAVGGGTNITDTTSNDGSAISTGSGNATGNSSDNDTTTHRDQHGHRDRLDGHHGAGPRRQRSLDNSVQDNDSLPSRSKMEDEPRSSTAHDELADGAA